MTPIHVGFTLACAVTALGIAAGVVVGHRSSDPYGAIRIVPATAASVDAAPQRSVSDWLTDIGKQLAIRPDQAAAWQTYTGAMLDLEASRRQLEDEFANGTVRDITAERVRHAMTLASALEQLEQQLSPQQRANARLLTQVLAATVICKELAVR